MNHREQYGARILNLIEAWALDDRQSLGASAIDLLEVLILDTLEEEGPIRSTEVAEITGLDVSDIRPSGPDSIVAPILARLQVRELTTRVYDGRLSYPGISEKGKAFLEGKGG